MTTEETVDNNSAVIETSVLLILTKQCCVCTSHYIKEKTCYMVIPGGMVCLHNIMYRQQDVTHLRQEPPTVHIKMINGRNVIKKK